MKQRLLSRNEIHEFQQLGIEQKDERNTALANAAKARAYELMMCLYAVVIVVLAFFDMIGLSAFFILLGLLVICQGHFMFRLWKYHKEM